MAEKIKRGDLVIVSGLPFLEGQSCVVLRDPYPAVFIFNESDIPYSEETQATDIMCSGRVYTKIKCGFLFKLKVEQPA